LKTNAYAKKLTRFSSGEVLPRIKLVVQASEKVAFRKESDTNHNKMNRMFEEEALDVDGEAEWEDDEDNDVPAATKSDDDFIDDDSYPYDSGDSTYRHPDQRSDHDVMESASDSDSSSDASSDSSCVISKRTRGGRASATITSQVPKSKKATSKKLPNTTTKVSASLSTSSAAAVTPSPNTPKKRGPPPRGISCKYSQPLPCN